MAGVCPITVSSWNEFLADPTLMYNLFWRNTQTGNFQFDPSRVNVMVGSKRRTLEVNTVEELMALKEDLLSKPMLLDVSVSHRKTENYVVVRVTTHWRGQFAVLLNPNHPAVRQPMEELFNEGADLVAQGKKFCLEFDLGPCIENWYAEILDAEGCYTSTKSSLTRFSVTNTSAYQHCFDCNVLWCVLGLPCWLLSAPPYMIHRACTVDDKYHVFNVPVVMRTPLARNHVVELIPGHNPQVVQTQRQVVVNRSQQQQYMSRPEGQAPQGNIHPLPPPPSAPPGGIMPIAPPPYSEAPPAYSPGPPVTQQPNQQTNQRPGNPSV